MAKGVFGQVSAKDIWTIPNLITYFRILCVPAFVALMAIGGVRADMTLFYIGLGVFCAAAASDLFDGWIARKFNMQSGLGMVLDPFADKFMHIAVLFCLSLCTGLTPLGQQYAAASDGWFVHWAFVVLLLAKELIMVLVAPVVMKKGCKVKANWMGKIASVTVSLGVFLAFFHNYVMYADWGILAWGVALSYAAGFSYLFDILQQIKKIKNGEMDAYTAESIKEEDQEIVKEHGASHIEG